MRKTMILLLFSFLLAACSDSPVCYYLDATGGDDNNSGLAPDEAWKSLEKLRGVKLLPGNINPEKPDVPLNKNDAFQKVQKRRVQEKR